MYIGVSHLLQKFVINISKFKLSDCSDQYPEWCPAYKRMWGSSDEHRPNWPDSINSFCHKTYGLCGTAGNVNQLTLL